MTEQFVTKDSGQRRAFSTGAVRDQAAGKGRFDLLPWEMIRRDAELMERGATKYGDRNWEKGISLKSCLDSAARHLSQLILGDRSEDHAAAARFNIAAYEVLRARVINGTLPATVAEGVPEVAAAMIEAYAIDSIRPPGESLNRQPDDFDHTEL